jgi:hypothetical protein
MRAQGARARPLDGEDLDLWTAESIARQRALRAAVLIDAIRCLRGAWMRGRPAHQSALRWILSRDAKAPFSLNDVRDVLGFDPSRLRRSLLEPAFGADGPPRIALGGATPPDSDALPRAAWRTGPTSVVTGRFAPGRDATRPSAPPFPTDDDANATVFLPRLRPCRL